MNLGFSGAVIVRVCFDGGVSLQMDDGEVRVECEAKLTGTDRAPLEFDPEVPGVAADSLMQLQRCIIADSEYDDTGTLRLVFEGGAVLSVPPDDDYEAWEVLSPKGDRFVCMPGGEIAVWRA